MKTDKNIQRQIEKAIESNTLLLGANIDVAVENGEARLTGHVDKFCKKELAKKIVKEVEGVVAVSEQMLVILSEEDTISDSDIETIIFEKFKKNFGNAYRDIKVIVKDGHVWLEGQLKWKYQKELAGECIGCVDGIKRIDNNITVPESISPAINEKDVLAAIYGDHTITTDIKVEILGNRVILKGSVENVNQKNLVTRLVRTVPGVKDIENFLSVDWMC